ncbi:cytochrome P450 CYP73A100-like [Zingiber officinale]|uniref:Uncharacterized protein n=1 Tax=Zingiber officinale TaxID=94328 RepID=A0A8J5G724_ZINOF|nr:cytochrome P450 CYP73A100-like [Zingiber officinale]KAG6497089.1 hypothetical protein ZIOFF_044976 [Zingiber officinale]
MAISVSRFAALTFLAVASACLVKFGQLPVAACIPLVFVLPFFFVTYGGGGDGKTPPGPVALPVFGNWIQVGNDLNHRNLVGMAKKYGDVFLLRLGVRNLAVVSDPKLAAEVLHTQGVEFGSRPRNLVWDIFTDSGKDMVFTEYGDHWRKMRRIMTMPFFTNKVVAQYREMWQEEMNAVVESLRAAPTEGVVVRRRLQLMLYNIMYRMMFDVRFESAEDPLFQQATRFNSERSRLAQSFDYNYGDFIPILRPFLKGYLEKCRDLQSRRLAFFNDNYVEKRRKVMSTRDGSSDRLRCAMDYILEAEMNGEISSDNVLYIVENINVAAIETTLWGMEWALAELVNHPSCQKRLREELQRVLGEEPVTETSLPRLPYLQAVVKETLRLHSPIPLLVPHMNLDAAKLGGYEIPKRTKVIVNAWWLGNNPEWWVRPEEFRPERFLEEEGEVEAMVGGGKVDFRFLPFGVGRRSCPGIILAMPLLGLVVGKLVKEFEMVPPPGTEKIDVTEKGGQFSLQIAKHATIVFCPVLAA